MTEHNAPTPNSKLEGCTATAKHGLELFWRHAGVADAEFQRLDAAGGEGRDDEVSGFAHLAGERLHAVTWTAMMERSSMPETAPLASWFAKCVRRADVFGDEAIAHAAVAL